jgi:hypothetical protein
MLARVRITRCATVTSHRSSEVWKVRSRARGIDQLQKSTGGTWPARPGEQPEGVADLAYKGCARTRVGSWTEVAKPRYQWRLRRIALSASDRATRTRTRRWKVLRAWETAAWVCCHVERVLGSGGPLRPKGGEGSRRDRKHQRSRFAARAREDNAQRGSCPALTGKRAAPTRGSKHDGCSWCTRHPHPRHHPGPAMPPKAANRRQRRRCCS